MIENVLAIGPWALGAMLLLSALGVPLPSTPLMIAAGALIRQGGMEWMGLGLAFGGVLLGDIGGYYVGRWAGRRCQLCLRSLWFKAQMHVQQDGAKAVLLSRFLFTGLDVPTNLVTGSLRFPFYQFLPVELVGRLLWVLIYGGLGYVAGSQWPLVERLIGHVVSDLGLAAVLVVGLILLYRGLRRRIRGASRLVLE
jgi:membrane protein DedA with SNARE-associated domain